MNVTAAIVTLCFGTIIGYLGQRSRLCFIGGIRDYYLVKDSYLVKGVLGFFLGATISLLVFSLVGLIPSFPWFSYNGATPISGDPLGSAGSLSARIIIAIAGGFGLGFFAVQSGGCPFRQHVMAAEGSKSAMAYLAGFYLAAVIFHAYVAEWIKTIFL